MPPERASAVLSGPPATVSEGLDPATLPGLPAATVPEPSIATALEGRDPAAAGRSDSQRR